MDVLRPFAEALVLLLVIVALCRAVGLRSFSKMSAYDFAITVAFGSTLAAAVVNPDRGIPQTALALAALFAAQWVVGEARTRVPALRGPLDNEPLLLMRDGEMIEANMAQARVTRSDLIAKLREANVLRMADVRAVVFETTGDVSVLHGDGLEDVLLEGVRGASG